MEQATPKDFLDHLNQGHYQAALDLGNELQLDTDIVYKAQWKARRQQREFALLRQDVIDLQLIKDDAWVISECLETLADDPDVQLQLLDLGKARVEERTEVVAQQLIHDNMAIHTVSENEKQWLRTRLYFLQYQDRFYTFRKIWPSLAKDKSFGEAYGQFRDANLIAQAIEFARLGQHKALDALFMHHGSDILPQRLFILSQISETADPSSFDLPHASMDHEDRWLEEAWRQHKDIVEMPIIRTEIEKFVPEHTAYLASLQQSVSSVEYPTSAKVIAQWYLDRAYATDRIGLSSQALELLRYAQVMGVTGIEDHVAKFEWLCKFIYSGAVNVSDRLITFQEFETLAPYEVLEGLLIQTNPSMIVEDMHRQVLPWLEVCRKRMLQAPEENEDEERVEFLLYRWLLDVSAQHMDWCCVVFEHSKPTMGVDERIVKDDLDLSRLALATLYSNEGSIEYSVRTFECLPIFENPEQNRMDNETDDMAQLLPVTGTALGLFTALQSVGPFGLTKMMDTLQLHLGSAEVLARYHASVPLRWFLEEQTSASQRQLCIRMASQAAGGVESGGVQFDNDDDWRDLLDDMLRLYDGGQGIFGLLSTKEILEIFFSSLLRCGRFRLAKEFMTRPDRDRSLDIETAERLVLDAEHEFFDNATSGNMHAGSMKQAMECLKVLPPTQAIKRDMHLIEATHMLISEYQIRDKSGMVLMPIQIRQCKEKLDLISKLINTRRGIYRQHETVLELTRKLGFENDPLVEVRTLAMLASAALVDEDYDTSYNLCRMAVDKAQSDSTVDQTSASAREINQAVWQICFNLGKIDVYQDLDRRLDILAMALVLSPVEYVSDILNVWRKVDAQRPDTSQFGLAQLADLRHGSQNQNTSGWQGLLESAKKHQWLLGDLLSAVDGASSPSPDRTGRRKRDQLREMVGGWLF